MSGGVLAELKSRADLRAHGMKDEIGDVTPNEIKDKPWVTELKVDKYLNNKSDGKWLIECSKTEVNSFWKFCRKMYHDNDFGISSMKVTTGHERYSSWGNAVIVIYCTSDESLCKDIGRKVLNIIPYHPLCGKIFYKTDAQTLGAETGSHLYWLPTTDLQ